MAKSYFNSMITGNSGMLCCLDDRGELIRLFWPHIDYPQHIDRLLVGITCPQLLQGASWLGTEDWGVEQYYLEDTNIAVTLYTSKRFGLKVRQFDFSLPDKDVLERVYEVENSGPEELQVGLAAYSSSVSTNPHLAGILFDESLSALIHYRYNYYYSVAAGDKATEYELGGNSLSNAGHGRLMGNDTIGMMKEGALLWEPHVIAPGGKSLFSLSLCFAQDIKTLKKRTRERAGSDPQVDLDRTAAYWRNFVGGARRIHTGNTAVDALYRRSLLVFALMADKKTGALLAAPELDEEFSKCGRYAYCWGRDAAFITTALDRCGLSGSAEQFYRWAAEAQGEDGSWEQRYHMDGNLAPSWGMQIDEGGSILWGMLKHYGACGNKGFLIEMWPSVRKGVEFLTRYIDPENGLPWLSFDLWEERLGEHAYSTAAVCAGMEAGAEIAAILAAEAEDGMTAGMAADKAAGTKSFVEAEADIAAKAEVEIAIAKGSPAAAIPESPAELRRLAGSWREAAGKMREALERHFWHKDWNRFVRSIRVKLNAWGEEPTNAKVWLKRNDKGIPRDYSLLDGALDISLLGMSIPFGLYPAGDPRMEATAETVELVLSGRAAGGLMRYEFDNYIGGNPWIISTLWAALYHIEKKSYARAREYFDWAVVGMTDQGLLPEQIDRDSGKPAWVIPLTWSHAMFVLVLDGLLAAGEL
jgi:oligosaccharide amylase